MKVYQEYKSKGLEMVLVNVESYSKVKSFLPKYNITMPVAIVDRSLLSVYGVRGYPSAFLLDHTGKIIWQGHPSSNWLGVAKEALKKLPSGGEFLLSDYPKKYHSLLKLIHKGKYGSAISKLNSLVRKEDEVAKKILKKLEKMVRERYEEAERFVKRGEFAQAYVAFESLFKEFTKLSLAKQLKKKYKELLRDKSIALEFKAAKLFLKAQRYDRRGTYSSFRRAYSYYRKVVKRYPRTRLAQKAKEALVRLKKELVSYNPKCWACRKAKRACKRCKAATR